MADRELYRIASNVTKPYRSIAAIHPLKQHKLEEFIEWVKTRFPQIEYIVVFGSTVDGRCRSYSDIDVCLWGAKGIHFYTPDNDVYDVIFAEDVGSNSLLRKEIERDGVVIYAKNLDA